MIASVIREGRIAKGYTQKELAELSHISIRSIQRIESGDILPRTYTLKALAKILDRPFEDFAENETLSIAEGDSHLSLSAKKGMAKTQRIILSIGILLVLFFLSWAFIAQSSRFPETTFEFLLFVAVMVLIATGILSLLWKKR